MARLARNSRLPRAIMLETLQPRELMAFDALRIVSFPEAYQPSLTGEQWADHIFISQ